MKTNNRHKLFPDVSDEKWNDWKWQIENRLETMSDLKKYVSLTVGEEEGIKKSLQSFRMAITPYYLSLVDIDDPNCPIRRQCIPTINETFFSAADMEDFPLRESIKGLNT